MTELHGAPVRARQRRGRTIARTPRRSAGRAAWDGDEVRVTLTVKNRSSAHVTIQVEPHYRIKNGGLHGAGITNWESIGVDAGAVRKWSGAKAPAGIKRGAKITSCAPEIESVEAG
jgi:hypothetical protein